jgi:O-Antigen ligase
VVASTDPRPPVAERLIVGTIGATWALWLVGGLYLAGPILGWVLALLAARAWYLAPALPLAQRPPALPLLLWLWAGGMLAMLFILLLGHANFDLGVGQTIKSAVGWAKGWALLALFPIAGFALPVRLEAVARAVTRLARQSLWLLPLFLIAPIIGLPETLWVSPLKILGGSGDEYFAATLYTREPGVGTARWQFFAPWSPAAGMVALVHLMLARAEPDARWRWAGYAAALAMILLSQSRLALVALVVILPVLALAGQVRRPSLWFAAALAVMLAAWAAPDLLALIDRLTNDFSSARADSSRVRAALGRIAIERWQSEAFWFGHGIVEKGPHLVEYMPIGSHHSWYGLLFVKGLAGALALAVPMIASLFVALAAATRSKAGQTGLAMVLLLWLYSMGENLEMLAYLTWPALIGIGIMLREAATRRPVSG